MLYWLAAVVKEARLADGKKRVHYAAAADVDQSTITRFENATSWPRDPGELVNTYAELLGVPAVELWRKAVDHWEDAEQAPRALAIPGEHA